MKEFKFVLLADVGAALANGWVLVDDMADCHHGHYSVLVMRDVPETKNPSPVGGDGPC